jgi:hypothetical protein
LRVAEQRFDPMGCNSSIDASVGTTKYGPRSTPTPTAQPDSPYGNLANPHTAVDEKTPGGKKKKRIRAQLNTSSKPRTPPLTSLHDDESHASGSFFSASLSGSSFTAAALSSHNRSMTGYDAPADVPRQDSEDDDSNAADNGRTPPCIAIPSPGIGEMCHFDVGATEDDTMSLDGTAVGSTSEGAWRASAAWTMSEQSLIPTICLLLCLAPWCSTSDTRTISTNLLKTKSILSNFDPILTTLLPNCCFVHLFDPARSNCCVDATSANSLSVRS